MFVSKYPHIMCCVLDLQVISLPLCYQGVLFPSLDQLTRLLVVLWNVLHLRFLFFFLLLKLFFFSFLQARWISVKRVSSATACVVIRTASAPKHLDSFSLFFSSTAWKTKPKVNRNVSMHSTLPDRLTILLTLLYVLLLGASLVESE